ncbi:MAG TPA: TfoX/Sxy family protein [Accumulibacter sp.]|nr:TfoX/Sxy family protein [Accumulibacter sp.]HQC79256.1 TfoX/Sxy family protein [Accumulibacter sp.]
MDRQTTTPSDTAAIDELPNLGPKSRAMLAQAGIVSVGQLRALGAVAAFVKVRACCGGKASLNFLWALEGALSGRPWQEVARSQRASLLLALDHHRRNDPR